MKAGIIAAGWGERLGQKQPKALTRVGGKTLIDYALEGLLAVGCHEVTCIINEAAREVPRYIEQRSLPLHMDWIIQTTPSSMHSFLIVLERLSCAGPGPYLITTVDSVGSVQTTVEFVRCARLFPQADVVLGLTDVIEDEKPLRVAMRGCEGTGILPRPIEQDPEAFEILAMTNNGFESAYVTSGFYWVKPLVLAEKEKAFQSGLNALRQYLGHLLKYGYRLYGVPLPPIVDVDRPEDIQTAEQLILS